MNTEAQEAQALLRAAFDGTLNLDASDEGQGETTSGAAGTNAPEQQVQQKEETKPEDGAEKQSGAKGEETEGAQIASKSGSYTIPYSKLEEARARAKTAEEENQALKAQLAELTAKQAANLNQAQIEANARADAGHEQTQADKNLNVVKAAAEQGFDMSVFGSFSEEDIAKGVTTLLQQQSAMLKTQFDAQLKEALAPLQDRSEQVANQSHEQAVLAVHPDAHEVFESAEFAKWVEGQPGFAKAGIEAALNGGSAAQVIDVFSSFKAANQSSKETGTDRNAVLKAIEQAKSPVPASLSELSGGSVGLSDVERAQALANDPGKLLDFMSTLSPEKAEKLMNSLV